LECRPPSALAQIAGLDVLVHRRLRIGERRQAERAVDQHAADQHGEAERQPGTVHRPRLFAARQVQRPEQEHRGDARAHRGLGHRHVHGVERHQHRRHEEAVDAEQHDGGEQVALHDDSHGGDGHHHQQRVDH
jgi:hypothetical protein